MSLGEQEGFWVKYYLGADQLDSRLVKKYGLWLCQSHFFKSNYQQNHSGSMITEYEK